jgi:hypothetical protein
MPIMPAHFTAGAGTTPLQAWVRRVSTVIGADLRGGVADAEPRPANFEYIAILCLTASAALLLIVLGHGAGRRGEVDMAQLLFWSGVVLLVVPISLRVVWPRVARGERFFLLFLLVEALFYYKMVYAPTHLVHHDEFLHWIAATDLMTAHRLFLSNPLLEIGPSYPALEILTTAIANLTGLPLFAAGTLLVAVLRGVFITALFLFYEKIAGSARISAIACLVYMGCSTFILFEAMFSYESLGIVLCALIFAVEARSRDLVGRPRLRAVGLIALLLAALAVTHHLSAAYAAIYLGALAIIEALHRDGPMRIEARFAVFTAILAIALPLLWMEARGIHLSGYLGPVVEDGIKTLLAKIHGTGGVHSSATVGAPSQPFGMRLVTLAGILLLSLGLATGFFRSLAMAAPRGLQAGWRPIRGILQRRWRDGHIVLLAILACSFPLSVAFRLTVGGWELGNRMGTLAFFGVGLLVAISVVHYWQGRTPYGWRRIAPALVVVIIVLSGVTSSALDPIHGRYRVAADAQSIEPMGIETALWAREWLGAGNRFTADRVNRLLLASYGRQDVRVKIIEGVETGRLFEAEKPWPDELWALMRSDIDFLLVDLRLSTDLPVLGFYFEPWDEGRGKPLPADALLKFNDVEGISRVYDNGFMVIYDVRGLHGRS